MHIYVLLYFFWQLQYTYCFSRSDCIRLTTFCKLIHFGIKQYIFENITTQKLYIYYFSILQFVFWGQIPWVCFVSGRVQTFQQIISAIIVRLIDVVYKEYHNENINLTWSVWTIISVEPFLSWELVFVPKREFNQHFSISSIIRLTDVPIMALQRMSQWEHQSSLTSLSPIAMMNLLESLLPCMSLFLSRRGGFKQHFSTSTLPSSSG